VTSFSPSLSHHQAIIIKKVNTYVHVSLTVEKASSKHTPDPLIAQQLHKKSIYILPLIDPHYIIKPESH